jgi:hypothetical protein
VGRLALPTSCSRNRRAANCATPRGSRGYSRASGPWVTSLHVFHLAVPQLGIGPSSHRLQRRAMTTSASGARAGSNGLPPPSHCFLFGCQGTSGMPAAKLFGWGGDAGRRRVREASPLLPVGHAALVEGDERADTGPADREVGCVKVSASWMEWASALFALHLLPFVDPRGLEPRSNPLRAGTSPAKFRIRFVPPWRLELHQADLKDRCPVPSGASGRRSSAAAFSLLPHVFHRESSRNRT